MNILTGKNTKRIKINSFVNNLVRYNTMKNKKLTISDLDGFEDICNETELFAVNAGCADHPTTAQREYSPGDYVNPQVKTAEEEREKQCGTTNSSGPGNGQK